MTCDQFERWLDQGTPAPLAAVASAHAQRCARCAASRSASRELDALLRSAPRAPDRFTEQVMDHLETPGIALLPTPLPWWIRAASEPAGVLALALAAALLWGWQRLWSFTETAAPAAVRVVEASLAAWVAELIAAPRLGPLRAPQVQVGLEVALSCLVLLASPALYRTTARITARVLPRTPLRAGWTHPDTAAPPSATLSGVRTLSPRVHLALRLALGLVGVALVVAGSRALARKARGSHALTVAAAAATGIEARRKPNRLIREKSPYLLQHAYNPVDWYPWGEEAFATARREDKPIFLSIGYSTCHWCHVMERESFENDSVAAALNASFVAIKVDREERPDVDRVYMSAMQAMGVGGGWPLNVFLTPDLKPCFGGTYFPPRALLEVLPRVREAWRTHRAEIQKTGVEVMAALAGMNQPDRANVRREQLLAEAYRALERSYDAEEGGFGTAPKFPSTVNLNFLLRVWARDPKSNARAREMVVRQLDRMQAGGIHDCLGGGFHRYSTDRTWLVPHFEKMLYDQAQLAWAYLEGYQVTGDPRYAETARGIFAYVARDLTSPEGAFDSAEDADSEGEEGKFYVWTPDEITAVLGPEEARLFEQRYGVTAAGNFEGGASILHEAAPVAQLAAEWKQPREQVESRLARSRAKLLAARERRVRPHRDDKVLTAWNGLMISALSRGARVLSDPDLANRAARAADFVWEKLRDAGSGELHRRFRAGEVSGQGQLDDYAYYALGLVDLYEATFEPRWLERAVAITDQQIERFWDETDGGFFESPAGDASIKVRLKDGFDGAEIAGNSIAAYTLQVLANLLDRDPWRDKARRTLDYFAGRVASHPVAMPQMLVAMDLAAAVPRHVVIAGRPDAADTRALISEFNRRFLPHDLLLLADGGPGQERLAALAPFTAPLRSERGRATAYVCEHYACRLPTTDRTAFAASLDANAHAERLR